MTSSSAPTYEIVIWWNTEEQRFYAKAPQLRGCMSDGATYAEAAAHLQEAMELWLETSEELGMEIPRPQPRFALAA